MNPRSAIVKIRSQRRYRCVNNPKGVIYLPNSWLNKKVKVVERKHWAYLIRRIHKIECALAKIRRIA